MPFKISVLPRNTTPVLCRGIVWSWQDREVCFGSVGLDARIWRTVEFPEQARAKPEGNGEKAKVRFREGSKAAQVYALLCRPEGATVHEIQDLTGWQRHSVRGFLSASVRPQGPRLRSFERQGERVYRVKS